MTDYLHIYGEDKEYYIFCILYYFFYSDAAVALPTLKEKVNS
jgi:hypothetical protein